MVLIENGLIRDVDFTGAAPPEYATVTDFGAEAWLLPGLVDAHVHLCWDASTDAVAHVTNGDPGTILDTARTAAATALRTGVTTVRDLGDRGYLALALRDQVPPTQRPSSPPVRRSPPAGAAPRVVAGVGGQGGAGRAGAVVERGRGVGVLPADGLALVVGGRGRGHQGRLDLHGRPVGVQLLQQGREAGYVRRRHRRTRHEAEAVLVPEAGLLQS